jgi:hypothetical protein
MQNKKKKNTVSLTKLIPSLRVPSSHKFYTILFIVKIILHMNTYSFEVWK